VSSESDLQMICAFFGVPAKIGKRVECKYGVWTKGTITGAHYGRVSVRLDGRESDVHFHPTKNIRYLKEEGGTP
jgi:hypothetical protein